MARSNIGARFERPAGEREDTGVAQEQVGTLLAGRPRKFEGRRVVSLGRADVKEEGVLAGQRQIADRGLVKRCSEVLFSRRLGKLEGDETVMRKDLRELRAAVAGLAFDPGRYRSVLPRPDPAWQLAVGDFAGERVAEGVLTFTGHRRAAHPVDQLSGGQLVQRLRDRRSRSAAQ